MARLTRTHEPKDFTHLSIDARIIGETNDCAVKAVAIVCGISYHEAHAELKKQGRKARCGTYRHQTRAAIEALGFKITEWTFMEMQQFIESRYPGNHKGLKSITSHHPRRFPKAWANCHPNMLFFSSSHVMAVKDGEVKDWAINNALRIQKIWEIEKA